MARDLLTAFVSARVVPLQRRAHKMCFLGSNRDPSRTTSVELTSEQVVRRVNKIANTKMPAKWEWGLKPYDHSNQMAAVCPPALLSFLPARTPRPA
jgi:hypothetical protein